jgi:phage terminase small subunit
LREKFSPITITEVRAVPTPAKNLENSTKHRTQAELDARAQAESSATPSRDKVQLRKPKLISKDKAANKYWHAILKEVQTSGAELLDNLDSEAFAGYCSMLAMRDRLATVTPMLIETTKQLENMAIDNPEENIEAVLKAAAQALKSCEGLSQNRMKLDTTILSYAEKLGLTPSGRARLAVKRAQQEETDDLDDLLDGGGLGA